MSNIHTIIVVFISALAFVTLSSNSGGRAAVGNSGATLAPGDGEITCASSFCHGNNAFDSSLELAVIDGSGNLVSNYTPGATYTVRLTTTAGSGNPAGYGFQMVSMDANNDAYNAWDLASLPSNSQITSLGTKDYFEHQGIRSSNEAEIQWTAPAEGGGSITFYAASIAANGNGQVGGDGGNNNTLTIEEGPVSSTEDFASLNFTAFPNPVTEQLIISNIDNISIDNIVVMNAQGQVLYTGNASILDVAVFAEGLNIIQITSGSNMQVIKVVK